MLVGERRLRWIVRREVTDGGAVRKSRKHGGWVRFVGWKKEHKREKNVE